MPRTPPLGFAAIPVNTFRLDEKETVLSLAKDYAAAALAETGSVPPMVFMEIGKDANKRTGRVGAMLGPIQIKHGSRDIASAAVRIFATKMEATHLSFVAESWTISKDDATASDLAEAEKLRASGKSIAGHRLAREGVVATMEDATSQWLCVAQIKRDGKKATLGDFADERTTSSGGYFFGILPHKAKGSA